MHTDLFADELICFRHYLRGRFHFRPKLAIDEAWIELGAERHSLKIEPQDGFVLLSVDALIDGIAEAHDARVKVRINGDTILFDDLVAKDIANHDRAEALTGILKAKIIPRLPLLDVLEIGSRGRDATRDAWSNLRSSAKSYVGVDILNGPNVDVVGDAHKLGDLVPHNAFDFIYSQWVFEHLAMPWVMPSQMNKVMRTGAEAFILTNHTMALHDMPWDFWRFSDSAWAPLFNAQTGFEIVGNALGEGMQLTPRRYHKGHIEHEGGVGFMTSAVWVKKISNVTMDWPVDPDFVASLLSRSYPKQIVD